MSDWGRQRSLNAKEGLICVADEESADEVTTQTAQVKLANAAKSKWAEEDAEDTGVKVMRLAQAGSAVLKKAGRTTGTLQMTRNLQNLLRRVLRPRCGKKASPSKRLRRRKLWNGPRQRNRQLSFVSFDGHDFLD
jgi:hypothetical protein